MKKLHFLGNIDGLAEGIAMLANELQFEVSPEGFPVRVEREADQPLRVAKGRESATISCKETIHFYRALGLLLEHAESEDEFVIEEEPQFLTNGVMIDVSQGNAVPGVATVKRLLATMAVMGLNMLMLYCEDSYEVPDEPYFGYMRGRYSEEELRECDRFAEKLGIEIIPCMQTLAHLIDVLKWDRYADLKEDDDTLLVGHEPVYAFIERMMKAAAAPFRTKRIHIGMDEAWKLGQGNYLLRNGFRGKADIMNEHLERVMGIVRKLGLEPMIWSDMYFRAASPTGDYYDPDSRIPQKAIDGFPSGLQLVYWDYYHEDEAFYVDMIRRHKEFGSTPLFAGGIWGWSGYAVDYGKTFVTTNAALQACKQEGVQEVFATIWGDGGTESSLSAHLLGLQLFAEHGYSRQPDPEKVKSRFRYCVRADAEAFYKMTYLDKLPEMPPNAMANPSKYLMWQDPLAGIFDKHAEGKGLKRHYAELADRLLEHAAACPDWRRLFELLAKTASVLSVKSELGIELVRSYQARDEAALRLYRDTILPALIADVRELRGVHRQLWMETNKPLGWEVLDIRYGGLLARLETAVERIGAFLNGEVEKIGELEEERLYFSGGPELPYCNLYSKTASASRLSFSYGF